jgi:fatty acid-binding protein DegV
MEAVRYKDELQQEAQEKMQEERAAWEKKLEEGAKELEEALKEQYPGVPITIAPLSLSIACHIGPGSFAVACSSKLKELE